MAKETNNSEGTGGMQAMPAVSSWHGGAEPKLQVQNTKLGPRLAGPRADTRSVRDVGAAARLPDRSRGRQKAGPTTARSGRKAASQRGASSERQGRGVMA